MNKMIKKVLAGVIAATMMLGSVTTAFAATGSATTSVEPVKVNDAVSEPTSSGITLTVNTKANGTVAVTGVDDTNAPRVDLSSKVTVNGVEYKVTKIALGTFANCKNVKTIALPSSITTIGGEAFSGVDSTLKKINIKSTKKVTVAKSAFNGVNTKGMTIVVSKKMSTANYNALVKALKAAGFKGTIRRAK